MKELSYPGRAPHIPSPRKGRKPQVCLVCNKEYIPKKDQQIYCSNKCRIAYQKGLKGP